MSDEQQNSQRTTDATTETIKVLLVEDSATEALLIQAVLEETRHPVFDVSPAGCLADALAALGSHAFDVVVLDLTLPDSSGLETFNRVRERFPDLAVVVVTANASKTVAMDAIKVGAQDYIVKEQIENMPLALSLRFAIERKSSENQSKRRQKNLETVIKSTPVGTLLVNKALKVVLANEAIARLVGKTSEALLDRRLGEALSVMTNENTSGSQETPQSSVCSLNRVCEEVFQSGSPIVDREGQVTFYVDGQERHHWLHICCSLANINDHPHVILALNDITSKVEAQQIKSALMSMVSHELRSPLGAMKEATEIVLEGLPGPINEKQQELLQIVTRNIRRLHRLTDDFLDFQKLQAGKMSFKMETGKINEIVEEVAQTMQASADAQGVSLALDLDASLPSFRFDRDRMIQVVINLVNNAMRFTERGGVTIKTMSHVEGVGFQVSDTGCGMPKEELHTLFQEFRQASNTKSGGTGLGLTIAKKIVDEHQGTIHVESELGQGTTFSVLLPAAPVQEAADPREALASALGG